MTITKTPEVEQLNFLELFHLRSAGINSIDSLLPAEIQRMLYSDILSPYLTFYDDDQEYETTRVKTFAAVEANPLAKKFLESLSFLYLNSQERGWDSLDTVSDDFWDIANPLGAKSIHWDKRSRQFLSKLNRTPAYSRNDPRYFTEGIFDEYELNTNLTPWLLRLFWNETTLKNNINPDYRMLIEETNMNVFSILLCEEFVPRKMVRGWQRLADEAETIVENVAAYSRN